jgi:hypothetical protein
MTSTSNSGRAASMARRKALAQGKAALPPPTERTRTGFRQAQLPSDARAASAPPAPIAAPSAAAPATTVPPPAGGRSLLKWRRQQLARGKAGLQGATRAAAESEPEPAAAAAQSPTPQRATASPAPQGGLDYPPKAFASPTQGGARVTGLRIGRGEQVTGDEAGADLPVSGTQYVDPARQGARPSARKIGFMRTEAGLLVSGTLVRSRVRITGDEAGEGKRITGELDGRSEDDLTPRAPDAGSGPQFPRARDPHGTSVFGLNLGRAPARLTRSEGAALETTEKGLPVTGTAVGRSARVTGDEDGACCTITGDQYATPAARASACGGRGGGTAPAQHLASARPDPVTGAKVTASLTWRGQRVTGPSVEHWRTVTGDEPGSCAPVTGTPYQGPDTAYGWCAPEQARQMQARHERAAAAPRVTGDVPRHDAEVTGTERGAARTITGTPYFVGEREAATDADALARIDRAFSVRSPQRQAQLATGNTAGEAEPRVTGSFAVGSGKVTGNVEFVHRSRLRGEDAKRPRITGEGRIEGPAITGDAWAANPRVTGTEGFVAVERNPSERAGKPHAFASARLFKDKGHHQEPRQIVTGMVGWTPKSAAKVTLSGGAQG